MRAKAPDFLWEQKYSARMRPDADRDRKVDKK